MGYIGKIDYIGYTGKIDYISYTGKTGYFVYTGKNVDVVTALELMQFLLQIQIAILIVRVGCLDGSLKNIVALIGEILYLK